MVPFHSLIVTINIRMESILRLSRAVGEKAKKPRLFLLAAAAMDVRISVSVRRIRLLDGYRHLKVQQTPWQPGRILPVMT